MDNSWRYNVEVIYYINVICIGFDVIVFKVGVMCKGGFILYWLCIEYFLFICYCVS